MTDHDGDRLDQIAASIRRVEHQQQRERMERRDDTERLEGRISTLGHRQDSLESATKTTAAGVANLLQRVVKVENDNAATQNALAELGRESAEQAGAMMAELGKVAKRFDAQDLLVDRRLTLQDQCLAAIKRDTELVKAETLGQSPKLDRILDADAERASYEAWSRKHAEKRAAQWERLLWWLKFALAVCALVGIGASTLAWLMARVR